MDGERGSDVFTGADRLEHCDALGRPLRKGSPEHLAVSDTARLQTAVHAHDFAAALAIGANLNDLYTPVTATFLEWCIALPHTLARDGYAEREPAITRASWLRWKAGISTTDEAHTPLAAEVMTELLDPASLSAQTIVEYRAQQAAGVPSFETLLLSQPKALYADFVRAAEQRNAAGALAAYGAYIAEMRSRHDLAGEFVSTYGGMIQEELGQGVAATVMQDALESCALLKGMWDLFASLDPELLAAVLAEHLRGHFSGPGRQGSVTIIEEADRYRLVFDPCGTGGAMRQRRVPGLTNFRDASAATWQRANEVPSYCAHCALNEITSIRRVGYPVWVTEFDPDPEKPCGWTVYKDPKLIPERYFTRLGARRP